MDFNGIRSLYLPLRPKARFSPGRKTPPGVSAPSAGLRPLIVSRVKCGGGPCRGHSVLPCRQGPPHLRLETISGRSGPCPVCENLRLSLPSPAETWTGGSRRNQLRRGHGSPPVLSEVPHELSIPMRTPKSANGPRSNSFRPDSPSTTNLPTGTEDSAIPLTTPDMVRSGRVLRASVKSPSVKSL